MVRKWMALIFSLVISQANCDRGLYKSKLHLHEHRTFRGYENNPEVPVVPDNCACVETGHCAKSQTGFKDIFVTKKQMILVCGLNNVLCCSDLDDNDDQVPLIKNILLHLSSCVSKEQCFRQHGNLANDLRILASLDPCSEVELGAGKCLDGEKPTSASPFKQEIGPFHFVIPIVEQLEVPSLQTHLNIPVPSTVFEPPVTKPSFIYNPPSPVTKEPSLNNPVKTTSTLPVTYGVPGIPYGQPLGEDNEGHTKGRFGYPYNFQSIEYYPDYGYSKRFYISNKGIGFTGNYLK